jgi:Type IV secretion system pilin
MSVNRIRKMTIMAACFALLIAIAVPLSSEVIAASAVSPQGLPKAQTNEDQLKNILSIVFGIVGALALLMLVVSGLRYVISGGDPSRISKAKDGIIYALVGLLIAIAAQAIVAFVVGEL